MDNEHKHRTPEEGGHSAPALGGSGSGFDCVRRASDDLAVQISALLETTTLWLKPTPQFGWLSETSRRSDFMMPGIAIAALP